MGKPTSVAARSFAGINGKAEATDEDLRGLIKAKFSTLVSAFRSFDKNGDGQINRQESAHPKLFV